MALADEDKTEVDGLIKTAITEALNPFKKLLETKEDDKDGKPPKVEIPVPNPPKSNEDLEKEKEKEEEKKEEKSIGRKLWEAIW